MKQKNKGRGKTYTDKCKTHLISLSVSVYSGAVKKQAFQNSSLQIEDYRGRRQTTTGVSLTTERFFFTINFNLKFLPHCNFSLLLLAISVLDI